MTVPAHGNLKRLRSRLTKLHAHSCMMRRREAAEGQLGGGRESTRRRLAVSTRMKTPAPFVPPGIEYESCRAPLALEMKTRGFLEFPNPPTFLLQRWDHGMSSPPFLTREQDPDKTREPPVVGLIR